MGKAKTVKICNNSKESRKRVQKGIAKFMDPLIKELQRGLSRQQILLIDRATEKVVKDFFDRKIKAKKVLWERL